MERRDLLNVSVHLSFVLALSCVLVAPSRAGDLLASGAPFPEWTLKDHTGKSFSSADLTGKTYLLWFYPKAMTPGCTVEGRALRDSYVQFQERGVVVLGVSFDDPANNARFVEEEQFPFRLLSDADRSLAVRVGAADSVSQPAARRISYLVGPNGKVLQAYPDVNPQIHAEQVLADLAEIMPKPRGTVSGTQTRQ
jgi:peroxiredoxin Q/BCP